MAEADVNQQVIDEITKDLEDHLRTTGSTSKEEDAEAADDVPGEGDRESEGDVVESDSDADDDVRKESEERLTGPQKEELTAKAVELKEEGNKMFRSEEFVKACQLYSASLKCCPLSSTSERSMIYNNRAAAKTKMGRKESAIK